MTTIRTYNEFHLGDNLVFLHFLRKLALATPSHQFLHAVHECHMAQLQEVINDVPNIKLPNVENQAARRGARNVWKNAGEFWASHRDRADHVAFHLDWFATLAREWGLGCPIKTADDLLFDYPALQVGIPEHFDFLVINSQPCSGQLQGYDSRDYLTPLILELTREHRVAITQPLFLDGVATTDYPLENLVCTRDKNLSVTDIGHLSIGCDVILGVATGPLWPCLNVWNKTKPVVALLDHVLGAEDLTGLKPNLYQVRNVGELRDWLKGYFSA